MDSSIVVEWVHILLRWFHIFTGILWIGSTWYFTWLDFRVREAAEKRGDGAPVWMVHSGGFYRVEKLTAPDVNPGELHWFKWEALFTLISGLLLLGLVYYMGGALLDSDVSNLTEGKAIALSLGVLVGGWVVYDLFWLSPLGKNEAVGAVLGYAAVMGVVWVLLHQFAPRAAYIHVGVLFGTIMTTNVWMRILPAQRQLVAALKDKRPPDQTLAARAKQRSKHNTYLVVPLVFTMISNHFPTQTYASDHAFAVIGVLILGGWIVAGFVRGKV
ncbi:MAG: urate hydroxylase PuuD [Deltaproteobacteria bacterium]|nr:urate hydroxylase PuuD [Deltaproteobacteria bacterium]